MKTFLGIDAGSAFIGAALVDEAGVVVKSDYRRHSGDPVACIKAVLESFPLGETVSVVRTGAAAMFVSGLGDYIDPIVAQVEGTRHFLPTVRNIIYIGAGSFSLTRLSEDGRYRSTAMNSACASGSGAFLDQQAYRLTMTPEQLAERAMSFAGHPPTVATRCAVFAKTDMIHLQQNGFTPEAIAAGLCRSLGRSTVDSLLNGHKVDGETVVLGGVALNTAVVAAIGAKLEVAMAAHPHPTIAGAIGAALVARHNHRQPTGAKTAKAAVVDFARIAKDDSIPSPTGKAPIDRKALKPPLELKLSDYPQFIFADYYVDAFGTEVALVERPLAKKTPPSAADAPSRHSEPSSASPCPSVKELPQAPASAIPVTLGIDIGSTSTKATLVDLEGKVVTWAYRKTEGDPINATKKIFRALLDLQKKHGLTFQILAAGTTGSGRKMMQQVLHADIEMNEITAHARAAVFMDPEVDTIIELGGQDAKFTQLQNGVVYNSVMNYVCAAGTGSFIEEQSKKLGVRIDDYADFCLGATAPNTSDRCTVFMERDLDMLLAGGWDKRQVAAAVLHSVRDNYLNKVVGQLKIGNRVYFQGATARNKALVAAFEQHLGKKIIVSPFCHMTGAFGMSLILLDRFFPAWTSCHSELGSESPSPCVKKALLARPIAQHKSPFRGLGFADVEVRSETEKCDLCANHCSISLITTEDETVAWGLMCGRDYADKRCKTRTIRAAHSIEKRHQLLTEPAALAAGSASPASGIGVKAPGDSVIGIPKTLTMWTYLPLWRRFFAELGFQTVLSSPARDAAFKKGQQYVTAEFCAPVIVSHGHVADLLEKGINRIFIPHFMRERTVDGFSNNHFCCYVQAHPSVISSLGSLNAADKLLSPVIDLRYGEGHVVDMLHAELGPKLGVTKRAVRNAYFAGLQEQARFAAENAKAGTAALVSLAREGKAGIVLIGRAYNTLDPGLNLQLPGKIAERGYEVLFTDMLPVNAASVAEDYPNMYWNSGQLVLAAARFVAERDDLLGIFFTSFSCGPDSYLLSYFKEEMAKKKKPYLVLQFDGHGADAGYMTRIEAALESFKAWRATRSPLPLEEGKRSPLPLGEGEGEGSPLSPVPGSAAPRPSSGTDVIPSPPTPLPKGEGRRASVTLGGGRPTGALLPPQEDLRGRLLFIPPMEPIASRLFAASFRGAGIRSEVLEETPRTLAVGLRHTGGGECVPCPTTIGSLIHTVEERKLDPKDVAFFMATAVGPCRFGQYNTLNKLVLRRKGWESLRILAPSAANNYEGLDERLRRKLWDVFVVGDIVRKITLRLRPYETLPGSADAAAEKALTLLEQEFARPDTNAVRALGEAAAIFRSVKTAGPPKPRVGIVGEIYVRCDPFINDNLIRAIERLGGEALLASLSEWILYVNFLNNQAARISRAGLLARIGLFLTGRFYHKRERALLKAVGNLLEDREDPPLEQIVAAGEKYVPQQFQGEAILTLGRAIWFAKKERVSAIVNASPIFCMPGTTTTAIFPKLERELGVPIICNFYDGSGDPNRSLVPYMHYIKAAAEEGARSPR
ncbi:MAG: acyl-CoA dehydratase activase [Planctomycetota bacterium]|nr:acyl-CoA dehydratase activase [Planctomycetota bacterium]